MLEGPALGHALREAMTRKRVTQQQVADVFGVKQPSVADWLKHGRVAKRHINRMLEFFSDVVGPEHWGLPTGEASHIQPAVVSEQPANYGPELTPLEHELLAALRQLPESEQREAANRVMARAEELNRLVETVLAKRGIKVPGYAADRRVEAAFGSVPVPEKDQAQLELDVDRRRNPR